jgi:CHAT domain/Family of unknown function (DUF6763)
VENPAMDAMINANQALPRMVGKEQYTFVDIDEKTYQEWHEPYHNPRDKLLRLNRNFTIDTLENMLGAGRQSVLHIASHFRLKPGNESDSYLVLGEGKTLSLARMHDDDLNFQNIDLVTLSTSNTAMGNNADGAEVESFGTVAQQQDAKAVLASLWAVNDASTSRFMQLFYQLREENGLTKTEALRQTQLAFIRGEIGTAKPENRTDANRTASDYSHPYHWAPFCNAPIRPREWNPIVWVWSWKYNNHYLYSISDSRHQSVVLFGNALTPAAFCHYAKSTSSLRGKSMSTTVRPLLGDWYQDLETQQIFKVVAVDEAAETVEIQYLAGEIAEFDLESWYGSEFELAPPPEDWSAPFDEMETDDLGYTDSDYHSLKKSEANLSDLLKHY